MPEPSNGSPCPPNPPPFPPFPVAESRRIYDSPWCGLRRDVVILPGGARQEYHVFELSDAVAVVPVRADGSIVMIGQYRYPHGETHWEIPAGRISDGESPEPAAERELLEETGYRAGRLVALPGFFPANGITAHYAHAFVALDCECVGDATPDDSEQICVAVFDRNEVRAMLAAGRIRDGFSAITLLYWLHFGDGPEWDIRTAAQRESS